MTKEREDELLMIAFGGGCHWCTEAVFDTLKGVHLVEQGWVNSEHEEATTPSEAVIVHYDEKVIELDILIEVHLLTHNTTSNHAFRKKYRSAIYTFSTSQEIEAQKILTAKQALFEKPLITKVYPFHRFRLNEKQFLNLFVKVGLFSVCWDSSHLRFWFLFLIL